MRLVGQKHGQGVKALINSFIVSNVHGMNLKNRSDKIMYCLYLTVA